MTMAAWWSDYVGIPFVDHGRNRSGCDCWGLVRLVLAERFGINLPSLADGYDSTEQRTILQHLIEGKAPVLGFAQVDLDQAQPGDVLVIRQLGAACHVGIMVTPSLLLHTEEGKGAVIEDIRRRHLAPRIAHAWRYHV